MRLSNPFQELGGYASRSVREVLLAVTSSGQAAILPAGSIIFGPVESAGEFATMLCGTELYRCHVDELVNYTQPCVAGLAC